MSNFVNKFPCHAIKKVQVSSSHLAYGSFDSYETFESRHNNAMSNRSNVRVVSVPHWKVRMH